MKSLRIRYTRWRVFESIVDLYCKISCVHLIYVMYGVSSTPSGQSRHIIIPLSHHLGMVDRIHIQPLSKHTHIIMRVILEPTVVLLVTQQQQERSRGNIDKPAINFPLILLLLN
jgi:hypothetical protein